jgi:hypothetical protein
MPRAALFHGLTDMSIAFTGVTMPDLTPAGSSHPLRQRNNRSITEPVVRHTVLQQSLADFPTASVEVRRITLRPDVVAGDVFFEPEQILVDRFDATSEGVTFRDLFLNRPGQEPVLIAGPPTGPGN